MLVEGLLLVRAVPTQLTWAQPQVNAVTLQGQVEDAQQCFPKLFGTCSALTWLSGRIAVCGPPQTGCKIPTSCVATS